MKRYIWSLIVVLLLTSLACTALSKSTPTAVPGGTTEPAGGTTEPTGGTTEPTGETLTPAPSASLENLNSYRMRTTYAEKYASGSFSEGEIIQSYTRDPRASHLAMTTKSDAEGEQTIEMIQIGTTQWIKFGESWMQSEAEPITSTFGSEIYDIFDFNVENMDDYEYLGQETVNGIRTRHYRMKEAAALMMKTPDENLQNVKANVEVWIADEARLPQILIKLIYTLKGTHVEKGDVEYTTTSEVYDLNANFTIEPPADGPTSLANDVPTYPGPTGNTFLMSGMASFETTDPLDTVKTFYQTNLPKQGWTLDSDNSSEGIVMQSWKKDNRTLTLMISLADNGSTSVILPLGE